jgi:hypothetical protein
MDGSYVMWQEDIVQLSSFIVAIDGNVRVYAKAI